MGREISALREPGAAPQPKVVDSRFLGMKTGRQCRIMAAEAAGRAYITLDLKLRAALTARSAAWIALGETADRQGGLVQGLPPGP